MLDAISHTNGTAQDNEDSAVIEAQVSIEEEPFEGRPEDLDKRSLVAEALETSVNSFALA